MITYTSVQNGAMGYIPDYRDVFQIRAIQTSDTAGYTVEILFKYVNKGCVVVVNSQIFETVEEANAEVRRLADIIEKEKQQNK